MGFASFPVPPDGDPRGSTLWLRPSPIAPFTPFRAFPSPPAAPRHRGRCLPVLPTLCHRSRANALRFHRTCTSRLCSDVESVARSRRFHLTLARCSPGLRSPSGLSPPSRVPQRWPSEITKTTQRRTATAEHRACTRSEERVPATCPPADDLRVDLFRPRQPLSPRGARPRLASETIPNHGVGVCPATGSGLRAGRDPRPRSAHG